MTTNKGVVECFIARLSAKSRSMSTDGETLFSYATPIARWCGEFVLINPLYYSQTTSQHQSLIRSFTHEDIQFMVPSCEVDDLEPELLSQLEQLKTKLIKARTRQYEYYQQLLELIDKAKRAIQKLLIKPDNLKAKIEQILSLEKVKQIEFVSRVKGYK